MTLRDMDDHDHGMVGSGCVVDKYKDADADEDEEEE